ncbi:unnamed protein product [Paramecium pentaurelia]|uniref:Uncharacterized protein n=1 Tax=Paramecium pentaurelia TaxID=43138 RepID=A0A8S1YDK0_9CILI|nr:unnamed protein product [Paramecium pentaurelia]
MREEKNKRTKSIMKNQQIIQTQQVSAELVIHKTEALDMIKQLEMLR